MQESLGETDVHIPPDCLVTPRLHSIHAVRAGMRLLHEVRGLRRPGGVEVDSREADPVDGITATVSLLRRPVTSYMHQARVSRCGLNWGARG